MEQKYYILGGVVLLAAGYWWWSSQKAKTVTVPSAQIPAQPPAGTLPPGYPATPVSTTIPPQDATPWVDPVTAAANQARAAKAAAAARASSSGYAFASPFLAVPQDPR